MFFKRFFFIFFFLFSFCFSQGRVDGIAAIVGKNMVLHSDILQPGPEKNKKKKEKRK
jgi:hypothetical protein